MRSRLLKILICLIMIISYIPITAISVESGESVVDGSTAGAPIAVPEGLLFRAEPYMESIKHGLQTLILIRERFIWLSLFHQA